MIGNLRTVFLDRDGVINRHCPGDYVKRWEEFEFLPRAKEALALLSGAGLRLIAVTNQRGVARGVMTADALSEIHRRMLAELTVAGASIAAVFACTHDEGACTCRKPRTGLFEQAQSSFPGLAFHEAALIGDSLSDLDAGSRLGCRSFLVADAARAAIIHEEAARRGIHIHGTATSLYEIVQQCILVEVSPLVSRC
jgi:D-glycero-D-manno-heptose 1,7-bisphosphate phosphatase